MNIRFNIKTVSGYPIIGNLLDFKYNRLHLLLQVFRECGDIGTFKIGPNTYYLFNNPEDIHTLLVGQADHLDQINRLRKSLQPMFGNGLATAQPEHHRRQRKLLTPIFQQRNLTQYADAIASYAEYACHNWRDSEVIDISKGMLQVTLRVIGKILFDIDVHDDINEIDSLHTIALRHMNKNMEKIIETPDIWSLLVYDEFGNAIKMLDGIIYKIIKDNRISGKGNLISILVNAQHENSTFMTDKQIRDEVLTLFIGGYETIANALAWTWYLVTQHDHVYRKLKEEVDRVLGGRIPTHADLDQLPYTLQVLKEAIRLYPPAYLISRQAIRPVEVAGIHFPVGTRLLVSPYTLHRRSDTFPAPEQFDPDRFSAEREGRLPRYAYLPFGTGPHGCIGFRLAIMEAHLVLAVLAQRVTFELLPNQALKPELSLTLRTGPLKMRVRHRDSSPLPKEAADTRGSAQAR